MEIYQVESCCGVGDISGTSELGNKGTTDDKKITDFLMELAEQEGGNRPFPNYGLYIFTAAIGRTKRVSPNNYGERFASFIERYKLGTVTKSPVAVNPNTKNHIRVYVWNIDRKATERWLADAIEAAEAENEKLNGGY